MLGSFWQHVLAPIGLVVEACPPFFLGAVEQLLQNLSGGAVDRGGRDAVKIGAAPTVVSAPPCDHLGHDFVGDVSQCLALQVRTGHQSVEVGESLIGADLVLPDLLEIARTRRVYEQIRGVRRTAL